MDDFIFFGTDEFAVKILDGLKRSEVRPKFIITTPDKPKGRKFILTPPPVKVWAEENGIKFNQPEKLKDFNLLPCTVAIVASYGKILPAALLAQPQRGFVNIHPSLLPQHRGATPLQAAILAGDVETGVSLMIVDEQMDHGAIIAQEKLVLTDQTFLELRDQTAALGTKLILNCLPQWLEGKIEAVAQNDALATYTQKIKKEDGLIDLTASAELNHRKIRAYTPWPGAYFFRGGKRIIIKKARLADGKLIIERVLLEGKKEMDYKR